MDDSCATCSTRLGPQPSKGVKVRILEGTLLAFMLLQKSTVIGENRCRGLSPLCLYKLGRVHLRYPARCEADARPGRGASVTTITAALARNPIAGISASIPMLTKGGRDALRLASRASTQKGKSASMRLLPALRTRQCKTGTPKDFRKTLSPMGTTAKPEDSR